LENKLDHFFLEISEPYQSALLYLRQFFINEIGLEENWKFNTPFYYYQGKWFCYLSYSKKRNHEIYIGFVKGYKVNHSNLLSEGRKQIKVYRIDSSKDIDIIELAKITKLLKAQY
jgi:hypothetical protein